VLVRVVRVDRATGADLVIGVHVISRPEVVRPTSGPPLRSILLRFRIIAARIRVW
jgi:hypothetical protein